MYYRFLQFHYTSKDEEIKGQRRTDKADIIVFHAFLPIASLGKILFNEEKRGIFSFCLRAKDLYSMSENPKANKQNFLLQQAREERNISQSQIAENIGVDVRPIVDGKMKGFSSGCIRAKNF